MGIFRLWSNFGEFFYFGRISVIFGLESNFGQFWANLKSTIRQNLFDRIMSKHMMDDHDLTDDVMALKSFERKMMDYLTDENHSIEQGMVHDSYT